MFSPHVSGFQYYSLHFIKIGKVWTLSNCSTLTATIQQCILYKNSSSTVASIFALSIDIVGSLIRMCRSKHNKWISASLQSRNLFFVFSCFLLYVCLFYMHFRLVLFVCLFHLVPLFFITLAFVLGKSV